MRLNFREIIKNEPWTTVDDYKKFYLSELHCYYITEIDLIQKEIDECDRRIGIYEKDEDLYSTFRGLRLEELKNTRDSHLNHIIALKDLIREVSE